MILTTLPARITALAMQLLRLQSTARLRAMRRTRRPGAVVVRRRITQREYLINSITLMNHLNATYQTHSFSYNRCMRRGMSEFARARIPTFSETGSAVLTAHSPHLVQL